MLSYGIGELPHFYGVIPQPGCVRVQGLSEPYSELGPGCPLPVFVGIMLRDNDSEARL